MPHIPYELPFEVTLPLGEGRLLKAVAGLIYKRRSVSWLLAWPTDLYFGPETH